MKNIRFTNAYIPIILKIIKGYKGYSKIEL